VATHFQRPFLERLNRECKMAMSQSERIRLIEESARKIVSRNKTVDSSLRTLLVQAQASQIATPQRVAGVVDRNDCPTNVTISGKGTNGEYLGLLQVAQGCAICPTVKPTDTGLVPTITIPTPCLNFTTIPFAQQNISTIYPAPYVAPCSDPGIQGYFPPKERKGENCNAKHLPYDSA
jgi:hypothetical protein